MKRTKNASNKVRTYLAMHPKATVQDIANTLKVSKATVYNVRYKMKAAIAAAEKPATANATQVGGTHYKDMGVEPWDVVDTWPKEQRIGYYRGNAVKYLMRLGTKGAAAEDAAKAEHYYRKLMEVLG